VRAGNADEKPKGQGWKVAEPISHIDWDGVQGQQYKVYVFAILMSTLELVLDEQAMAYTMTLAT
jgi:hypothetical protein